MKKRPVIFSFTLICCLGGALFFLIQRKWLIIQWTFSSDKNEMALAKKETVIKKEITFYWWKKEAMHAKKGTLIWRHDRNADNIKQIISIWIGSLNDEKIIEPGIAIDSAVFSPSGQDLFISFNQQFPWKEWSIHKKWMLVESLCKTIKSTGLPLKYITFFVNQEPMPDDHLDFTHPWSIDGFYEG